jgi:pimeloyl-ACP methyl ester carboxylesterase
LAALDFGPHERPIDLVFLHANGFNALTYRRLLQPQSRRYRLLGLDLRGHGASTLPALIEGRTAWDDFRDDLLALLDALAIEQVVLAGHSMGGTTCLAAAALAPARVRRLVLIDPVIPPPRPTPGVGGHDLVEGARRRRSHFSSRAAALEAYVHRRAFAGWAKDMLADYVEAGFHDVADGGVRLACSPAWEASNFVLASDLDAWPALENPPYPVEIMKAERESTCQFAVSTDNVSVRMVAGASHFLPMEQPELVGAALADAIRR